MLTTPKFHHLHLNSIDPDAAIDFYTRQFPSTSRGSWGAFPALRSPNDVMLLFTKVEQPPASEPQSAIWHFGWHVTDSRRCLETYKPRVEVELLPLYTTEEGGEVLISSDTWPALNREGMFRAPRAGVEFGDVALIWYANQGETPLVGSRGQLQDHIALSVADLDTWVEKLLGEGVTFLEDPYPLGDTRAVMIEGPSHEALELVEVK